MKYPNRIKELRLSKGLTQEDIFLKLGWDKENGQPRFSKLENGNNKLQFKTACEIAAILDVAPEEIAGKQVGIKYANKSDDVSQTKYSELVTHLILTSDNPAKAVDEAMKRFLAPFVLDDMQQGVDIDLERYARIKKSIKKSDIEKK